MFLFEIFDWFINLIDIKNYFNRIDECICFKGNCLKSFWYLRYYIKNFGIIFMIINLYFCY